MCSQHRKAASGGLEVWRTCEAQESEHLEWREHRACGGAMIGNQVWEVGRGR